MSDVAPYRAGGGAAAAGRRAPVARFGRPGLPGDRCRSTALVIARLKASTNWPPADPRTGAGARSVHDRRNRLEAEQRNLIESRLAARDNGPPRACIRPPTRLTVGAGSANARRSVRRPPGYCGASHFSCGPGPLSHGAPVVTVEFRRRALPFRRARPRRQSTSGGRPGAPFQRTSRTGGYPPRAQPGPAERRAAPARLVHRTGTNADFLHCPGPFRRRLRGPALPRASLRRGPVDHRGRLGHATSAA